MVVDCRRHRRGGHLRGITHCPRHGTEATAAPVRGTAAFAFASGDAPTQSAAGPQAPVSRAGSPAADLRPCGRARAARDHQSARSRAAIPRRRDRRNTAVAGRGPGEQLFDDELAAALNTAVDRWTTKWGVDGIRIAVARPGIFGGRPPSASTGRHRPPRHRRLPRQVDHQDLHCRLIWQMAERGELEVDATVNSLSGVPDWRPRPTQCGNCSSIAVVCPTITTPRRSRPTNSHPSSVRSRRRCSRRNPVGSSTRRRTI